MSVQQTIPARLVEALRGAIEIDASSDAEANLREIRCALTVTLTALGLEAPTAWRVLHIRDQLDGYLLAGDSMRSLGVPVDRIERALRKGLDVLHADVEAAIGRPAPATAAAPMS